MSLQDSYYRTELPQESDVVKGCDAYLIIDCAHLAPDFYTHLSKVHGLKYQSLFKHTVHLVSAEAGPVLVRIQTPDNDPWLKAIIDQQQTYPSVLWLWSELSYDTTFNRLQSLLFTTLENGTQALCRYYDPRCISSYINVLMIDTDSRALLRGIRQFAYWEQRQYQYVPVVGNALMTHEARA